jgi:large exoprotein involved in heme utilization and adhesion
VGGRFRKAGRHSLLPWLIIAVAAGIALCPDAALPQALPTGGHYVAGQGAIATHGSSMTINQSTLRGIINWQGFSIGADNAVHFSNGSGATLNRVTGAQMSQIEGLLSPPARSI